MEFLTRRSSRDGHKFCRVGNGGSGGLSALATARAAQRWTEQAARWPIRLRSVEKPLGDGVVRPDDDFSPLAPSRRRRRSTFSGCSALKNELHPTPTRFS